VISRACNFDNGNRLIRSARKLSTADRIWDPAGGQRRQAHQERHAIIDGMHQCAVATEEDMQQDDERRDQ
jgi:hypothetical protein